MLADKKDFLRTLRTCYNYGKLSHFAQDCTEPEKAGLKDCIQEISNINKDEDKGETKEEVKETLKIRN